MKQDFNVVMKKLAVVIEKTSTGFSAYSEDYPVYTSGGNVQELANNIIEALNFYFSETGEKITVKRSDLNINFSIPSFFELYPINVRHFAERIGMNYTLLSQYVQGRKHPSEKQTQKIIQGLQQVGKELSRVTLI
jgi:hypothetical protein